jgi:hypothetical protein
MMGQAGAAALAIGSGKFPTMPSISRGIQSRHDHYAKQHVKSF